MTEEQFTAYERRLATTRVARLEDKSRSDKIPAKALKNVKVLEVMLGVDQLIRDLAALGYADGRPEFKFHQTRNWRFDAAWPEHMLALEVEGGIFTGGRHTRGTGYHNDMIKYREAAILGWRLIRTIPAELADGTALALLRRFLKEK